MDIEYQIEQEFNEAGKAVRFAANYDVQEFMRQLGLQSLHCNYNILLMNWIMGRIFSSYRIAVPKGCLLPSIFRPRARGV